MTEVRCAVEISPNGGTRVRACGRKVRGTFDGEPLCGVHMRSRRRQESARQAALRSRDEAAASEREARSRAARLRAREPRLRPEFVVNTPRGGFPTYDVTRVTVSYDALLELLLLRDEQTKKERRRGRNT